MQSIPVSIAVDSDYLMYAMLTVCAEILGGPLDGVLQEYRVFDETALLRAPDYLTVSERIFLERHPADLAI